MKVFATSLATSPPGTSLERWPYKTDAWESDPTNYERERDGEHCCLRQLLTGVC